MNQSNCKSIRFSSLFLAAALVTVSSSCFAGNRHHSHAVLASVATANALSSTPVLGDISYCGTGCPAGQAPGVVLSEADHSLAVLPQSMVAETLNSRLDRKSCMISIPLQVGAGKSLRLSNIRSSGSFDLQGNNASLSVNNEVFFAGARGPALQIQKTSADGSGFFDEINSSDVLESPCGQDINLRVNSSLLVSGELAQAQLNLISAQFEIIDCQ